MNRSITVWVGMTILALGSLVLGYSTANRASWEPAAERGDALYVETLEALRDPSLFARGASLAAIFASATRSDLDAITRAYEQTFAGLGPGAIATELFAELWARHDAVASLERASGWRPFRREQFVSPLMNAWARRSGRSARDHLDALEGEKLRVEAEKAVALGLFVERGDQGLDQYWAEWPFGEAVLLEVLGRIALSDGFESLIEQVERLPAAAPEEFRARALRGVAGLGGRIDPARTASFVEEHADASLESLRNLRAPFVGAWAQTDPRAALDWLMTQPPEPRRGSALRVGYRSWALNPETAVEAVEWIEAQPADVLPPVLDFYALALVNIDADRAIAAAERIEAPNRDQILKRVKRRAERRARTAAGAGGGENR